MSDKSSLKKASSQLESRPIALRAFVKKEAEQPQNIATKRKARKALKPSAWVLVFDTETTTDETQNLRFGTFQVRKYEKLEKHGVFYNADSLTQTELDLLIHYAQQHSLECISVRDFIDTVFFKYGYDYRGTIVGFNLPFDISRLAIEHSSARSHAYNKIMAGGFSFKLSDNKYWPRVQIKHISSRNAFIQFTKPAKQQLTRSERKKQRPKPTRRGFFIDCKTLAAALTSQSYSLDRLANALDVSSPKLETESHGQTLTSTYIEYALGDTQTTWECYQRLLCLFSEHDLSLTEPHIIHSEASLGKAYFKQMGIQPWQSQQPDFPNEVLGIIMSTYYGGRSEVHIRKQVTQVLYTDFLSMYPTVCTLMGLWQFMIAKGIEWDDTTEKTRSFVENLSINDLQPQTMWKQLTTLVKVLPNENVFPIRAKYEGAQYTIGQNYLTSESPLWFTLSDCISSKLLTGKCPTILEATTFYPLAEQDGLNPVSVAGDDDYQVDPYDGDFFKRVIDQRRQIKAKIPLADKDEKEILERRQLALKILANATSYGIFVELNVEREKQTQALNLYGYDGKAQAIKKQNYETTGKYFNPLLATLITGAARLMLSITERLAIDAELNWGFCDTDSMALAKPDEMDNQQFIKKSQNIVDWFVPLNPYDEKGSLLKMENYNYCLPELKSLQPLYCLAISSKRYALFNIDENNKIRLRKVSAHGLGHLLAPYHDETREILEGALPWQQDLWLEIIRSALEQRQPNYSMLHWMKQPAISRYATTTPQLLRWCYGYNKGKPYAEQIKPFNFLLVPQGNLFNPDIKPISPFQKDNQKALEQCFDRETSNKINIEQLKSFSASIAQYHLHPESKFLNADFIDVGMTKRRHINVNSIQYIGKEANKWEEQFHIGFDPDAQIEYGVSSDEYDIKLQTLRETINKYGAQRIASKTGYSKRFVNYIYCGERTPKINTINRLLAYVEL